MSREPRAAAIACGTDLALGPPPTFPPPQPPPALLAMTLAIPFVPGVTLTGLVLIVQAAVGDPADTAGFELTNVAAVRIDLF